MWYKEDHMKTKIDNIIAEVVNPKGFAKRVASDSELHSQIKAYIAVHQMESVSEAIYCISREILPNKCPCGKKALFNSYTKGYRKFCDRSCISKGNAHSSNMKEYWKTDGDIKKAQMSDAVKNTMLERYGVENVMHHDGFREKIANTNIERYGAASPFESSIIKEKIKETLLSRYGVEYPFQSAEIRAKADESFITHYGHKNDMSIARQAFVDQYGGNPFQIEWVKDSIKSSMIDRHGANHPMKVPAIHEKSIATLKKNYGKLNPAQLHIPDELYGILNDKDELCNLLSTTDMRDIADRYNVSEELLRTYHDRHELNILPARRVKSRYEEEIAEFLNQHGISYKRNCSSICYPRQVDFYLEQVNLAIEFNGLYWHSEFAGKKDKTYHSSKQRMCADNQVQLLTIFEDEWIERHTVIKNKILHLCGKTPKSIGARKVKISIASDMDMIKKFLSSYHLQGKTEGISIALIGEVGDEVVSVMTLRKHTEGHDMTRYCVKNNAVYPGLFSKFIAFIKKQELCKNIITFADLRWSTGDVYEKSGFQLISTISPDYSYTDYKSRDHKFNYRKDKMRSKFNIDITDKTEIEIARELGLDRIWDCGKLKYKLNI